MAYSFDHDHGRPPRELADLLGGKGAGLAEMTTVLDLPVPPGFTLPVEVCRAYRVNGWPRGLDAVLDARCRELEDAVGRRLGDADDPLLVAVRSGAARSMPGMLDTVLNLGLNEQTTRGLAARTGDPEFAWDSYLRFLRMYARTVLGVPEEQLRLEGKEPDPARRAASLRTRIAELAAPGVPDDPLQQLRRAVEAVFRSWDSQRAVAYRRHESVPDDLGTAVTIQAMVFGNRGRRSGTGVVFTRNPNTGAAELYGDYLPCAQGEDVVAGTATTLPISELTQLLPDVAQELRRHLSTLERHYRDLCDVEFTIEEGRLWILQTRVGKRGAVAAVRTAVALVADPHIALSRSEALDRVTPAIRASARAEVIAAVAGRDSTAGAAVVRGLPASPGRVSGGIALTADEALDATGPVILVRPETSPEDVAGMSVSVGILTARGGLVSHAAVVARGWGIAAVVGAQELDVLPDGVRLGAGGPVLRSGEVITLDGATGEVWVGERSNDRTEDVDEEAIVAQHLPELAVIEQWEEGSSVVETKARTLEQRMRVEVDRERCTGLGICEAMAGDVFEVDESGQLVLLQEAVGEDRLADVRSAVDGCPTEALRLVPE